MLTKFHGNILNLSENIAKSFRGGYFFLTHTVYVTIGLNDRRILIQYTGQPKVIVKPSNY